MSKVSRSIYMRALAVALIALTALLDQYATAGTLSYYYDALGRVIGVYTSTGASTTYVYDGAGNRISYNNSWMNLDSASASISAGQALLEGQAISSVNGVYELILQTDGNLVLYKNYNNTISALWSTNNSVGLQPGFLTMQSDGNLVLYGPQGSAKPALWSTGTSTGNQNGVNYATLQCDGNFVIYGQNGAVWSTGTAQQQPTC